MFFVDHETSILITQPYRRPYRPYDRSGEFERRYDIYEFKEGMLTLTIINAARNALIWEDSATTDLEPDRSKEYKEQKTQEIVAKLLAHSPPL